MLENYFRVTYRNILKQKGYALINILGLAIGLACCLLIMMYVYNKLRYDRFHEHSDRIYRLVQTMKSESRVDEGATTPFPAGPTLESVYSGYIEASARLYNLQVPKLSLGIREEERYFKEPNFFFADSTILEIFSFELIRGNPETALDAPQSVILTQKMAQKYFGDKDPIGRQLYFEGRLYLTVTGVMKELPDYSHLEVDFLASFTTLDEFYKSEYATSWYWNPCWTYLLLKDPSAAQSLERQLSDFADTYYHPNIPKTDWVELGLQPITDIHLYSNRDQEIKANSNIRYVYIFSVIAALILVIACINFMNLATARSAGRAEEIGMRKVLGSDRWRLFLQFMTEAYLMSLAAILLAIGLVYVVLPFFNELLHTELSYLLFRNGWVLSGLFLLFLIVGGLSGCYPAVVLSGQDPIRSLRGDLTKSKKGLLFRKALVVVQFSCSIILIIGTAIVYQQLNLLREKNLGFDKEQVVIIPTDLTRTIWFYDDFRQQLLQNANIRMVTGAKNVLGSRKNMYHKYRPEGYAEPLSLPSIFVMHDFIETYDIKLLAGRSFSREYATDRTEAVIINEQAVRELEWDTPRDALGKSFEYDRQQHYVIGVTENFNHTSLRRKIEPLILDMPDDEYDIVSDIEYIAVKINGQKVEEVLDYIRSVWQEFDGTHPFEYFFHDQRLNRIYQREESMASITASFSILAIIVACLGLFGLASYTLEKRTREIGIRKALGASIPDIVSLLSREFLLLVLVSNLLAWPVIWFAASEWLENFPYRVELGTNAFLIFAGAGTGVLLISLLTVSYQSIKAALINPAETIRDH